MAQQCLCLIAQQRDAVLGDPAELSVAYSVTHGRSFALVAI
jgi:hypothetical protein